jgi:putative membrane protein
VWVASVLVWLLVLTATPITIWVFGYEYFGLVASLGVLAQFAATVLALHSRWSVGKIVLVVGVVAVLTWLAEFIGHQTGLPFGHYTYTAILQPQVGGVPIIIPLAWMMMLGPAWAVTDSLFEGRTRPALSFALVAALAITAWDFYLDPQMVSKGLWVWAEPGGYFGIPWVNYGGWVLTAGVITWVLAPRDLPRTQLMIIYTLTWVFQAVGLGVLWQQPGPALVGFMTMGVFSVWAWRKEYGRWLRSSSS